MRYLRLLAFLISVISLQACRENSLNVDLCVFVNHIDGEPLPVPYFQCANPDGVTYEFDFSDERVDRYRAVSPSDYRRIVEFCSKKDK